MIATTENYKEVMQRSMRNRAYARISYGIINNEANENTLVYSQVVDWGNGSLINEFNSVDKTYATFEKNRFKTKLNSGFKLKPTEASQYQFEEHFISTQLSNSDKTFTENPFVDVTFDITQKIYGLTILFDKIGNTYPESFEITTYAENGDILSNEFVVENNYYQYIYEKELLDVKRIYIVFYKTKSEFQRIRISKIEFGVYQVFENNNFDSSRKIQHIRNIDPVSINLSNSSLQFTIHNEGNDYNALNPVGLWRYIEENQPVKVEMGRELDDGTIEWLETDNLILNEDIIATESNVTFKAKDKFYAFTTEYYSKFYVDKISYYDLAEDIILKGDFGPKEYLIDERLKDYYTNGLIEVIPSNQALQLIANATNSIVFANNKGQIVIEIAFDPIITIEDNGHSINSVTKNIVNMPSVPTTEYATFDKDFMETSSEVVQLVSPYNTEDLQNVGYISDVVANENGVFDIKEPTIIINYSMPIDVYQLPITFNNASKEYATEFKLVFMYDDILLREVFIENNIDIVYFLETSVIGTNKIELYISKWSKPHHRAVVNQFGEGRINDFYLDFNTATTKPVVNKTRLVKSIDVSYYEYNIATIENEKKIYNNKEYVIEILHEPLIDVRVELSTGTVVNLESYAYFTRLEVDTLNIEEIILYGKEIDIIEQTTLLSYNRTGEPISHKNPLINDFERANSVGSWLYDYYSKNSVLKVPYRGNPELEPFDTIYMQSQFEKYTPTKIVRTKITFGTGLNGEVEVIKI